MKEVLLLWTDVQEVSPHFVKESVMKKHKWFAAVVLLTVFMSWAGNAQWMRQSGGLPMWSVADAIDASGLTAAVIIVREAPAMMYTTTDAGAHFRALTNPTSFPDWPTDVSMVDSLHIWVATNYKILATNNGGQSWQQQFYDTTVTQFIDYVKMFDLNNGVAIGDAIPGKQPAILQTADGGAHWINMNTSLLPNMVSGDVWLRIDFVSKSVGYFYTSSWSGGDNPQRIYKTTDGGTTWAPVFAKNGIMNLKFYNEKIGLARGGYYTMDVYRTFDGGASWDTIHVQNYNPPGWGSDFEFLPGDPSRVWHTDVSRLYFSSDTGHTWRQQTLDTSVVVGRDIVFTDATHGWLLCDNGRLYHTVNGNQIVTSVGNSEMTTPSGFHLEQNYPNPFNPSTTISYSLPKTANVSLRIFNTLGQEVAVLVNERREAGNYQSTWNASNVPSGIYFCRLQAGEFIDTKKAILLK